MSEKDETTAQREAASEQKSSETAPAEPKEKPSESAASTPASPPTEPKAPAESAIHTEPEVPAKPAERPAAPAPEVPAAKPPAAEQKPAPPAPAAAKPEPKPEAKDEAKPVSAPDAPAAPAQSAPSATPPAPTKAPTTPAAAPTQPKPAPPAPANAAPKSVESTPVTQSDTGRDTLFVTTPSAASTTKSAGYTCPKCGHLNRAGILVCEKCGTLLIGDEQVGGTKRFEEQQAEAAAASGLTETSEIVSAAVSTAGSAQFSEQMVLRLEIEGAPTPILLHPKYETSLGRRDPATGTMPDVDLSAYAGYRLGVSRKHAIIRLKNERLEIYDLGSSNGTSVNGTRLIAHQPQVLRDGDEVLLGKMMVRVLFQVRSRRS